MSRLQHLGCSFAYDNAGGHGVPMLAISEAANLDASHIHTDEATTKAIQTVDGA
jgi:hypothetical protein